jgi:DNA processing protein
MNIYSENLYLHAFNLLPKFGPKRLMLLARAFENFQAAFEAKEFELIRAGLTPDLVADFIKHRDAVNLLVEIENLKTFGIELLSFKDPSYPKLLLETASFPPLLYYKGKMDIQEELCLAVVGTRKITNYGRTVVPELVEPLAEAGITIVSGLAYCRAGLRTGYQNSVSAKPCLSSRANNRGRRRPYFRASPENTRP